MPGWPVGVDEETTVVWPRSRGPMAARFAPIAALFLASGAALVLAIVLQWSLLLAFLLTAGITGTLATVTFVKAPPLVRRALARRIRVGLAGGVLATLAYDAARFGVVSLFSLSFKPFHALEIFGQMFVGEDASPGAIWAAGIAFHLCNGITFGIAYTLVFRRPSIPTALLWAGLLEAFMITLYPGWLNVQKVDELALVSILGHVAFGIVLGASTRWMLDDTRRRLAAARARPIPPPPTRIESPTQEREP